jgi:hypothetical protein
MPYRSAVNRTHSGLYLRQRDKAALRWKLRFVLTLRESGGFSGTSPGVIQPTKAPSILLASSELLETSKSLR